MDGTQEYDGGITVELKDTQEFGESKITKRTFEVSMEQVMVANYACAIAAPADLLYAHACALVQLFDILCP